MLGSFSYISNHQSNALSNETIMTEQCCMNKFAFVLNPFNIRNVHDYNFLSKLAPPALIKMILRLLPPFKIHYVKNLRSAQGAVIDGYFIVCPLLSKQVLAMKEEAVLKKILKAVRIGEQAGAKVIGLGALMGIAGKGGQWIAEKTPVAVTTGSSLAAAAILDTLERAAVLRKVDLSRAKVAIVGATNAIGQNCALGFLNRVDTIFLIAKNTERLVELKELLVAQKSKTDIIDKGLELETVIKEADILIFTTSAIEVPPAATASNLKKGAIICDIPSPRNIHEKLCEIRKDILVIDGAVIEPPQTARIGLKLPIKDGFIYACMAETMILAFEGQTHEDFSTGFKPNLDKVANIKALAAKHGFEIKFTSFGVPIS
jgi:fatty aldehyde-generating acyl-ACP reductase